MVLDVVMPCLYWNQSIYAEIVQNLIVFMFIMFVSRQLGEEEITIGVWKMPTHAMSLYKL